MKKLLVISALLAAFAWGTISYAGMAYTTRVIVYKGTIKASASIFDVNDPNKLFSDSIKVYWAVQEVNEGPYKGDVVDSNAVLYNSRMKWLKRIPDAVSMDPCDPCNIVMFVFNPIDADGEMLLYAVGRPKLAKLSNDTAAVKDYAAITLKGTGIMNKFDVFSSYYTMSGPVTVTMTMDTAKTRLANTAPYTVDEIINLIIDDVITVRGGQWSRFEYDPVIL